MTDVTPTQAFNIISNALRNILNDLHNITPVVRPYQLPCEIESPLKEVWSELQKASDLDDQINMMVYAFFLWELLKSVTKSERNYYIKKLEISRYFISASKRIFYTFEDIGVEQINKISTIKLRLFTRLHKDDYKNLLRQISQGLPQYTTNMLGAPNLTLMPPPPYNYEMNTPNNLSNAKVQETKCETSVLVGCKVIRQPKQLR
ncbi:6443_t:CDS:2, partial [Scutellospora calospora]